MPRVLIAGVGGASLGTELLKALSLAGSYTLFACDISPLAFGHYMEGTQETFVVDPDDYVASVLGVCRSHDISYVVAGAEGAMTALNEGADAIAAAGITVAGNSVDVVRLCSDKAALFTRIEELGFEGLPWTRSVAAPEEVAGLKDLPSTCIVKPATGSGGSSLVFLATAREELESYVRLIASLGQTAVIQEYVSDDEGEFTIGVLSRPDGSVAGSIAMKRLFHTKLSVMLRSSAGLISSGYSQGLIEDYADLRTEAETLAVSLGSVGPLNVQGRVRNGRLVVFEINPRFSASTYLRALAGFNEVDAFLRHLVGDGPVAFGPLRPGYYLRSLDEVYVPVGEVKW